MKLANIEKAVLICCTLHNFLRRNCKNAFMMSNHIENTEIINVVDGEQILVILQRGHNRHAGKEEKEVRETFFKYFNEEGQVIWQHRWKKIVIQK